MSEARRQPARSWSLADAERYLASIELFGMRFGLDRMRRLMTVMGLPQERFRSIHVVGTNGKSSTTRMIAALLERHGLATGAYLSPHLVSFAERVQVRERDLEPEAFAAAIARAARAAGHVDHTLAEGDRVTQFEVLTAAAYSELAERGVEVAVIEAGLGGRFDATSVIHSEVQVLTNVGLEHTRWLGPTLADIAGEKLAVVRAGATLVTGADLDPEVDALAEQVAAERGARLVRAAGAAQVPELFARGAFQRRNFALAQAAAEAFLGHELDPAAVRAAAATPVPGRFQVLDGDPPTVLDGAHNPGGVAALVESLPEYLAGRPLTAVISILDDKDAAAMLRALLPLCRRVLFTKAANARALPPATLESLARQLGGPPARSVGDPGRALLEAGDVARAEGGVVLATGSIYLIADMLRARMGLAR